MGLVCDHVNDWVSTKLTCSAWGDIIVMRMLLFPHLCLDYVTRGPQNMIATAATSTVRGR